MIILNGKHIEMYTRQEQCQCVEILDVNLISTIIGFNGVYSFRGQSNINWSLKTSIERFIENNPTTLEIKHIEERIINRFKQYAKIYLNIDGIDLDKLNGYDINAVIQHYGGPTRLLDFTDSFINALSFAVVENSIDASAVYCIRRIITDSNSTAEDFLRSMLFDFKSKGGLVDASVVIPDPIKAEKKINTYFSTAPCLRNIFQNGHFLIPNTIELPFEKVLANNLEIENISFLNPIILDGTNLSHDFSVLKEILEKSTVLKIVFPASVKRIVRNFVFKNTSLKVLYPDIFGVIKSLYEIDTSII